MSAVELRVAARAAIKAGRLPMPVNSGWGGELQGSLTHSPQRPIYCAACGSYMRKGDAPYKLADFPGQPVMRHPQCVEAWHQAARDAWGNAFDDEDFHLGDERTGEGCLIWASLPPSKRVRFFVNRSVLIGVLDCPSFLAGATALARCREWRPSIEQACRQAFGERPGGFIELQASDFLPSHLPI